MNESRENIWIIGFGRFGRLALDRLSQSPIKRSFLIVDPNMQSLERQENNVQFFQEDGVGYLQRNLSATEPPDWIVPALPIHLAAQWCLTLLAGTRTDRIQGPKGLEEHLPSVIYGPSGDIYVSLATFMCPDDCPEPIDHCTITQKRRGRYLFDLLEDMHLKDFQPLVLRSHQLAPGIGGYKALDFMNLFDKLQDMTGKVLLATSCRCHGVITPLVSYAHT